MATPKGPFLAPAVTASFPPAVPVATLGSPPPPPPDSAKQTASKFSPTNDGVLEPTDDPGAKESSLIFGSSTPRRFDFQMGMGRATWGKTEHRTEAD